MHRSVLAALLLLAGCSTPVGSDVILLPCPPALFSAMDIPGSAVEADGPRAAFAAAVAPRAKFDEAYFEKAGIPTLVGTPKKTMAEKLKALPPAPPISVETTTVLAEPPGSERGFAAMGGGVARTRPAMPMLRSGGGDLPPPTRVASLVGAGGGAAVVGISRVQSAPTKPLDQARIAATVRAQMPRIRACYERVIKNGPRTRGKVVFGWTIQPDGSVEDVHVDQDELNNDPFLGCAARSLARWRFPKGTETVDVSYPFVMTSRG